MATVKKMDNSKCWRGRGAIRTLHCWWDCTVVQPLWKTVWRFPKRLNIVTKPSNSTPRWIPRKTETCPYRTATWMFVAAFFMTAKKRKQPSCPSTDAWLNKAWSIGAMDCSLTIKRSQGLIHAASWTNPDKSQTRKARECRIPPPLMSRIGEAIATGARSGVARGEGTREVPSKGCSVFGEVRWTVVMVAHSECTLSVGELCGMWVISQ